MLWLTVSLPRRSGCWNSKVDGRPVHHEMKVYKWVSEYFISMYGKNLKIFLSLCLKQIDFEIFIYPIGYHFSFINPINYFANEVAREIAWLIVISTRVRCPCRQHQLHAIMHAECIVWLAGTPVDGSVGDETGGRAPAEIKRAGLVTA